MEKKNHLFDESIERKIERQRGPQSEKGEENSFSWLRVVVVVITVLFAVSFLLRIFMH